RDPCLADAQAEQEIERAGLDRPRREEPELLELREQEGHVLGADVAVDAPADGRGHLRDGPLAVERVRDLVQERRELHPLTVVAAHEVTAVAEPRAAVAASELDTGCQARTLGGGERLERAPACACRAQDPLV